MKKAELLIKHLNSLLNKATDTDIDGVDYWTDLTIPACDLQDLSVLVRDAQKELNNKMWDEFFTLLNTRLSVKNSASETCWIDKSTREEIFKEVLELHKDFVDFVKE